MKDFLKFTFASVIGVILAGVVFTILGIITLVGIVASSDTETVVKDNSIFVLDFKGSLSERVQETHSNNFWEKNLKHTVWMTF